MNLENRGNFDSRIRNLWSKSFNDSTEWLDNYFAKVFNRDHVVSLCDNGRLVSSLVMQPYGFNYFGSELPAGYIIGACTDSSHRGKGLMTSLMRDAVEKAYERGIAVLCLIPASRPLFFFYDRFDFSSVFFIDQERYTSLHTFRGDAATCATIEDVTIDEVYSYFHKFEKSINACVLHSRADFDNILWDNASDNGKVLVSTGDNAVNGVAFAVPGQEEVVVKELMTDSAEIEESLLAAVKMKFPGLDIVVDGRACEGRPVEARGMLRITDAYRLFETLARFKPDINQCVKLSDPIIKANNHIYLIKDGKVEIDDTFTGHIDTEVDVKILAEVLFNTPATGNLFGLPACRPSMSLMLE